MSNILVIKHGSLGDIVQISGVLRDIRESHINKKIFILTTSPYVELLSKCPYLDGVLPVSYTHLTLPTIYSV